MLGFGLGLRNPHFPFVIENRPREVDWFELITENFMLPGGNPRRVLREVRKDYPIVFHGTTMNLGSRDGLDKNYLRSLRLLIDEAQPEWVSDHLCWVGIGGKFSHDLLPVAYSEESLRLCVDRVDEIQNALGRTFVIENPSSYLLFRSSVIDEWDFMAELHRRSGCEILLDINNVYVSSFNHGWNAKKYIDAIPVGAVRQFHLAGHLNKETHLIDTHDHDICHEVWELYEYSLKRFGAVATMIERDDDIPEFPVLVQELDQARVRAKRASQLRPKRVKP